MSKKIAVVGAGTAGYLSVLYFCTKYPEYNVCWIYPADNEPIGVGEGTVPQVTEFLKDLGITFKDIINDVGGSLKLGIKFENFVMEDYFHPFGGADTEAAALEYIMKYNKIPDDIESYDISFHFSVATLATFLDKWFERFDNLTIERRILHSVDDVTCDWLIDCTGFKRAFVNKYYDDNFLSIDNLVPNNKALVYRTNIPEHKRTAYTTCIGMDHGWIWNIPLRDQIGIGYVHSNQYDVKEEFLDYLEREGFGRPEVREVNMVTGRNKHHYKDTGNKKIVSVGLSSSFIEPLEATGLYLTVFGIEQLNKLMHDNITPTEYNTVVNYEFDVIVDFIAGHYKFGHRNNDYWNFYKTLPIELYRENAAYPKRSWNYILQNTTLQLNETQKNKLKNGKSYAEWLNSYLGKDNNARILH
jgi:tryptophan 7-halogenase